MNLKIVIGTISLIMGTALLTSTPPTSLSLVLVGLLYLELGDKEKQEDENK